MKTDEDMRVGFCGTLVPEFHNKTTESEAACCCCGIDSDEKVIRVVKRNLSLNRTPLHSTKTENK
jgi:hypothetical protein